MIKRLTTALAIALALMTSAHAADRKPLVIGATGQQQQILDTDTLKVPALKVTGITGLTQCAQVDSVGVISGTGSACSAGGGTPGGSSGQVQYNNAGAFGGFTASGDATINTSTGAVAVSKTGGVSFGYFSTGTDAANLTGTVSVNRFNSGTGASSTTYLSGAGTWTTPAGSGTVTTTGSPANGNLAKFTGATSISNGDLSGDVTTSGALATTLATVNSNVGSFGDATHVGAFTVNAKGLVTAASSTLITSSSCANPCQIGTPYIRSGTGAPGPADPKSSLYLRNDIPQLWLEQTPVGETPARVQEAAAVYGYALTLGATPTPGNYLVGMCYAEGSLPSASSGYTTIDTHNVSSYAPYARVVYRLVVSGDAAAQTICTGGSGNYYGASLAEVSGLDPIWANSFQAVSWDQQSTTGSGALTANPTGTTAVANTLGIALGGMAGSSNVTTGFTYAAGYSNAAAAVGVSTYRPVSGVATGLFASPSSTADAQVTSGAVLTVNRGITAALVLVQPAATANQGWRQMSKLTDIKSGGSTITPTGMSARSINFTNGLSATDDGNGNATAVIPSYGTGTALDNIGGLSSTGFLTRTGAGTYAFQSTTNGVAFANIAQLSADSIAANFSGATGNIASQALPSCSGSNDALFYNTTTHAIGCHAPSGAGGGTVTSVATNRGLTGGPITGTGTIGIDVSSSSAGDVMTSAGSSSDPVFKAARGTSFPGSPSTGDRFFRSDRGIEYYYDGTRWLSVQIFTLFGARGDANTPASATGGGYERGVNPWGGLYDVYMTEMVASTYKSATSNWTVDWQKWTGSGTTSVASFSNNADTVAVMTSHRVTINAVLNNATDAGFQSSITKNSGTGSLYFNIVVLGRLIGYVLAPAWVGRRRRPANDNADRLAA